MILAELLTLPSFQKASVVAGKNGLQREVISVNMMDAPDIIHFLKPDELLLTTAYAMKDHPESLNQLVKEMAQKGCAGLGIKTKRFVDHIPTETIKIADDLHFPLIELPLEISLGELLNEAVQFILNAKTRELREALDVHRDLSDMVMKGKGIDDVIHTLSRYLKCPVVLLDQNFSPLSSSRSLREEVLAKTIEFLERERPSIQPFSKKMKTFCLSNPDGMLNNNLQQLVVCPIHTYQKICYLVLFYPLTASETLPGLVIEQAVNVIGFELMKQQAVKERMRRYKNEFFSDLVDGLIRSEQELINRGRNYGLTDNGPALCIVGKLEETEQRRSEFQWNEQSGQFELEKERFYTCVKRSFARTGLSTFIFTKNDCIVILVMCPKLHDQAEPIIDAVQTVQSDLQERFGYLASFGIGRPVEHMIDVKDTYKEAVKALQKGTESGKKGFVEYYQPREILSLLRQIPEDELRKFRDNILYTSPTGCTYPKDDENYKELLHTVKTYLENHGKIQETANQLFIHRNTVVFRLEKFKNLMHVDLDDPQETLQFRIAFQIQKLLGE